MHGDRKCNGYQVVIAGAIVGMACRLGIDVTRCAIVLQTSAGYDDSGPYRFHYFLAAQQ